MQQLPKAPKIYRSFWISLTEQCLYFETKLSVCHDFEASTDAIISLRG
jgi:hypothetical protein